MSTRPQRPGAPVAETGQAPSRAPAASNASFEELRNRHEALVRSRGRLELLHEQATSELQACQAEAAKLGVDSLQQLEQLIEQSQAEDLKAMESFEQAVQAEDELQKRVMADLAAIGE